MMRDRRSRLISFIDRRGNRPWCAVKIGFDTVTCAVLTDDALEDLAGSIRAAFWRHRHYDRVSRAAYAARVALDTFMQAAE